jgi:tetratricopeptide (TPR) repeat protein
MAVEGLLDTEDQNDLKAEVYYKLGAVNYLLGKRTVALEYLAKSETLVSEESNVAGAIQCQFGQILFRSGQYDSATRRFERSMKCYRATGDKKSECSLLVQAALIPFQLGDWKRVRSYYSKSLRIAQEIGDRKQSGTIHMNLGIIASIQGDFDRALELYEKSRKIYEEIEDIGGVGKVWLNTGWSHGERKRWPEARHAYNESLQIARKTRNINEEAKCNTNLAEVMLEERDLKGCKRNCVEALEIFSKINYQVGMADVYKTLGQVSTIERKWPEATAYFDKSISITRTVKHGLGEGKALMELARMRKEQGEFETANQDLDQAITRFEKIESAEDLNTAGQLREEIEALQYLAQE